MPARQLTIHLLRDGLPIAAALKARFPSERVTSYPLAPALPFTGTLHLKAPNSKLPSWLAFVQAGVTDTLPDIRNTTTASAVLLTIDHRTFALTFGYGRSLLALDAFEPDFGLRVAVNTVDPTRLRTVDLHTFEALTLHTRRQASKTSPLEIFGVDISRDLLRAVTGEPKDEAFASRVTGSDALAMVSTIDFGELGQKCRYLLRAYQSKAYRQRFSWIDQLKRVRDDRLREQLDDKLLKALQRGITQEVHLAPPEPLDWQESQHFSYTTKPRERYDDLDVNDYLATLSDPAGLTVDEMRQHKVAIRWTTSDSVSERWSVYACMVYEVRHRQQVFVLTAGSWFCVAKKLADDVQEIAEHHVRSYPFLGSAPHTETEQHYNDRIGARPDLTSLDRALVRCSGAQSQIETCDLFTKQRQFIHVKRKTRSATLSHLFAQGAVSAEAFLRDESYRTDLKALLTGRGLAGLARLIPTGRPRTTDFEVVYAVIAKEHRAWPDALPFFSKLHFAQAVHRLELFGFRVGLVRIPET